MIVIKNAIHTRIAFFAKNKIHHLIYRQIFKKSDNVIIDGDWGTMLSISGNDNLNNINENSGILRAGLGTYKNGGIKNYSSDFVDETDISSMALKLYEREQDVQKFSSLALGDMTAEENDLMVNNLLTIASQMREDELATSLLSDERFIRAMFE